MSIPWWATPGRQVVCVRAFTEKLTDANGDKWPPSRWGYVLPDVNGVYITQRQWGECTIT